MHFFMRQGEKYFEFCVVMCRTNIKHTDSLDYLNLTVHLPDNKTRTLKERIEQFESAIIKDTLETCSTLKDAADILAIDLSTLVRKKQKYGISKD